MNTIPSSHNCKASHIVVTYMLIVHREKLDKPKTDFSIFICLWTMLLHIATMFNVHHAGSYYALINVQQIDTVSLRNRKYIWGNTKR